MDRSTAQSKRGCIAPTPRRLLPAGLPTVCPPVAIRAPMRAMRRLKRAMLVIATGEILSSATSALAEPPSPNLPASAPITLSAPLAGATKSGQESKSDGMAAATDSSNSQAAAANSASPGAGYSWRDKPSRGKHKKLHSTKVNPNLTQAKGPEFVMATDGTSHITVQLSRKVEFNAHATRRRYVVELPSVQVAVANDMNPLITTHFATPLQDARLIAEKKGARLVIDLRESVTPQITLKDGSGGAILEVVLPKSIRRAAMMTEAPQQKGRLRTRSTSKPRISKDKSVAPQNGMGPRL